MEEILVNIFFAYSREDSKLRERLDKHLSGLRRRNFINTWYDGEIDAGTEWEKEIDFNLSKADIILLLISADFIASDYCYEIEMKRAIQRHENGEAIIIPILLNPCDWSDLPFSKIQGLPQNGKPITSTFWDSQETALNEIANSIKESVDKLRHKKSQHLKSITEVLKDKDNKLRITLEQIEELTLDKEIIEETIDKSRKLINELDEKIRNLTKGIEEQTNTFELNKSLYERLINSEQVKLNRLKSENEKLKLSKINSEKEISLLEKKKINIEEDILRMKK